VQIDTPPNDGYFVAPAAMNIVASASDPDGSISKVEFYVGATKIGEDSVARYEFEWTNVPAGTYTLRARAYDNAGGSTFSLPVQVLVAGGPTATPINTTRPPTATATPLSPTATNTPLPPTATLVPTVVTNTPLPPTATPTATLVPTVVTNTPVPPTATATPPVIFLPVVSVNFQPGNVQNPSGYLVDDGELFADRGNGSVWEITLPNGVYRVRLVAGAATGTGTMRYAAEGVSVVNGAQTASVHWVEGTATVTVNDGRLTITNGAGSTNNKLCFVEIFR
jgi:hypothetical protein